MISSAYLENDVLLPLTGYVNRIEIINKYKFCGKYLKMMIFQYI